MAMAHRASVHAAALLFLLLLHHGLGARDVQPEPRFEAWWLALHEQFLAEAAAARASGGLDTVMYGDSIMERFRGTLAGNASADYAPNKAAWERVYGGQRADVFAAGGDGTLNLLWRLEHGEGPAGLNPQVVFLMIGANDVLGLGPLFPGQGSYVAHAASVGVQRCIHSLRHQAPNATVVVLGILPIQIPTPDGTVHVVDDIIAGANEETAAYVARQCSPRLVYKDCGPEFLLPSGDIDTELMPDGVHPNGDGAELLLACMQSALDGSRGEQLEDDGEGVWLRSMEDGEDVSDEG